MINIIIITRSRSITSVPMFKYNPFPIHFMCDWPASVLDKTCFRIETERALLAHSSRSCWNGRNQKHFCPNLKHYTVHNLQLPSQGSLTCFCFGRGCFRIQAKRALTDCSSERFWKKNKKQWQRDFKKIYPLIQLNYISWCFNNLIISNIV